MAHHHNWQPLMPSADDVAKEEQLAYAFMVLRKGLAHCKHCTECGKTGHSVHGRYIKTHRGDLFLKMANELREQFGLPPLSTPQPSKI